METEKLYYADSFLQEFTATVLDCHGEKSDFFVTLNRTAFYPEGGGQPADHGTLGGAIVRDVREKGGVILHLCDRPLEIGAVVSGRLDWERRFDHMQQHSGEHVLSGMICASHGYDNVGFHMGADTVTIDFNGSLTETEIAELERRANLYLYEDHPVDIRFPTGEQLEALDYRSKKELTGQVRIVTFPGADCCACCGTHLLRSGQVGLIKILSYQKFREGVRLEILCGRRALSYLSRVWEQNRTVAQRLSVKAFETAAAVERMEAELAAVRLRKTELEDASFLAIAQDYVGAGDTLLFPSHLESDGARKLADAVAKVCGGLAAVFSGGDEQYHYALVRADGMELAPLVKELNAALHGRGGGRGGFAQGSVQAKSTEIQAFFRR